MDAILYLLVELGAPMVKTFVEGHEQLYLVRDGLWLWLAL